MPDADPAVVSGDDLETRIAQEFSRFASQSKEADRLAISGRFLTTECLVGSFSRPVHLVIREGRVIAGWRDETALRFHKPA
jgi:hypothetical protein